MMARDPYEPSGSARPLSRRVFLARSAGAALAVSGAGALLAACGKPGTSRPGAAGPQLASPEHPVAWPIAAGNQPIADGLEPERGAVLKIYNWTDYIYKKVAVEEFQKKYKKYGVKVQISTFNTMDEAIAKLRTGQVDFDLFFPTYDRLGKIIQAGLLRPLNHSYIPNISDAATEPMSVKIYAGARSAPTPALNALATVMLVSSLLAVALGVLVYRRLTRGERGTSAVADFASQL
jgi:spermidine/putrescine-binding protein